MCIRDSYRPAHFATVEPFLIAHFLLYLTVAILYARRAPLEARRPVDALLVFGVPLVAFGLQAALLRDSRYGVAASAFALAALYGALALILRRRERAGYPLLARAFVALGANLVEPQAQVRAALAELARLPQSTLVAASSLYRTAPVGLAGQPDFINAVAALDTSLSPDDLLEALFAIERSFGRVRKEQYLEAAQKTKEAWAAVGMTIAGVEGHPVPFENLKAGTPQADEEIENTKWAIEALAKTGIDMICYNFMAGLGWTRTNTKLPERGGALTSRRIEGTGKPTNSFFQNSREDERAHSRNT